MSTKSVNLTLHLSVPKRMSIRRCQELIESIFSLAADEAAAGIEEGMFEDENREILSISLIQIEPTT